MKPRKPVTLNGIERGQNPSECKKKTGSLEMLELVMARADHIAQEENNLSIVLTEMSADCPGGLEVSTADQYSQDLRFKSSSLQ
jgi:hypothetical protein